MRIVLAVALLALAAASPIDKAPANKRSSTPQGSGGKSTGAGPVAKPGEFYNNPKPRKDDVVIVATKVLTKDPLLAATSSAAMLKDAQTPNGNNQTWPLLPNGDRYVVADQYGVARPDTVDPKGKDSVGVNQAKVERFGAPPPEAHPMEVKTPLGDFTLCNTDRVLSVDVLSAKLVEGEAQPMLPTAFGCSSEKDMSREKASPAVKWSGFVPGEVEDYSMQMISMGENCAGPGADGFNRIHWHVTGMRPFNASAPEVVIKEGASKDRRLLLGGREQPNQWLEEYYSGPCPPPGVTECFRFKVVAHLHDGKNCLCGHQDVQFYRPFASPSDRGTPFVYKEPVLAPVIRNQAVASS